MIKIDDIFADTNIQLINLQSFCTLIQISQTCVFECPIDKESTMVQVIVLNITEEKPLPESMVPRSATSYGDNGPQRAVFIMF